MQIKTLIYNNQNHFSLDKYRQYVLSYLLEQALASIHSLRQSPQIHENFEGGLEYSFHSFLRPHTGHLPDCLCFKIHTIPRQVGLNGVNRQPSNGQKKSIVNRQKRNIFTVNRQTSEPKLAVKFVVNFF